MISSKLKTKLRLCPYLMALEDYIVPNKIIHFTSLIQPTDPLLRSYTLCLQNQDEGSIITT